MAVTASFQPEQSAATSGHPTSLTLHLQNDATNERVIPLSTAGDLARLTRLSTESVRLDAGEHFEVPVTIDVDSALAAGSHACIVDVASDDEATVAIASIEVETVTAWTARLVPVRSAGSARGRHKVAIENRGNAPVTVAIAMGADTDVVSQVAAPSVDIQPGASVNVALRVIPMARFWTGPAIEHPFVVSAHSADDDVTIDVDGVYEQRPRIPTWTAPALAGMLGALLIATLAWFALLRPEVEDIAREEAAELDLQQQALIDERVDAIEAAAAEASRLPLGDPTDLRMSVSASPATTSSDAFDFDKSGTGRLLSITDVIFQNPTGAVGRLELLRDDQVLFDQELANFRDLDFHLVAPLQVDSESTIALRLTCDTPGPGTADCEAAATVIGFVDDI